MVQILAGLIKILAGSEIDRISAKNRAILIYGRLFQKENKTCSFVNIATKVMRVHGDRPTKGMLILVITITLDTNLLC